jgi:hypothetical protein
VHEGEEALAQRAIIIVSLQVQPKDEAAFTDFYHHAYIPRLLQVVPEITSARRYEEWGVEGSLAWFSKRFLSVYELACADLAGDVEALLGRAGREAEKAEWERWRGSALRNVQRTVYRETWAHDRMPCDGRFGNRPFFVVSVETGSERREAFRAWYEELYLPKIMADVPTWAAARRYTSVGRSPALYQTVYEAADEAGLIRSFQLMRAPYRYGSNAEWNAWVGNAITWQDATSYRPIFRMPG